MRILLWTEAYYPTIGGIELVGAQLLGALQARGCEFIVVTTLQDWDLPDLIIHNHIPVYRFHFRTALESGDVNLILRERQRVAALKREFAPDLIHLFGFGPSLVFHLQTRQARNVPSVLTFQTAETTALQEGGRASVLGKLLATVDWVTSVSQLEAQRVLAFMPELAPRVSCIHNSFQEPPLAPAPLSEPPTFLCVGRFSTQKRFDLAIRAFARVVPFFPNARLVLAGDGPEREQLEELVAEPGLEARVEFTGWMPPDLVPALINRASAVILPSDFEGLPLIGIQAAQMARPLLATPVGGLSELVVDGETGILTPPGDVEALAEAMKSVLADPLCAAQMGKAAKRRVQTLFSFEQMVNGYAALYERLMQHTPGAVAE